MTVNERLSEADLLEEFDQAVRQHNREQLLAILQKVELTFEQATYTTDTILAIHLNMVIKSQFAKEDS
jgi:hypothetical protein